MSNNKTGEMNDTPTPPHGEEGGEVGIKHHLALRRRYEAKKKEIAALTAELTALRSQLSEAQAWKESMLAVTPDMQKIGKLLNVKLGESVHDKIIPGIEKLQQEVAEAQENYEKVWDECSLFWIRLLDKYDARLTKTHARLLSDHLPNACEEAKTTFINKIKKGKE
jgi:hypothetical protein